MVVDPAPVGEREDERLVEAAAVPEVGVLEAGVVLEAGAAQTVGELLGVALGDLAVDDQTEAFLERQGDDLGRVELLGEGLSHPGASCCWGLSTVGCVSIGRIPSGHW